MAFYSANNERIGLDGITSSSPIRFTGSGDAYTVCILFIKPADGGEAYGRLVSNASSGNGNNGYECCASYSGVNDRKLLLLLDGAGGNIRADAADIYANGDTVAAFFHFNGSGNEKIYGAYNKGTLKTLADGAVDDGPFKTADTKFRIGGAGWGTTRDVVANIYRVLIYDRLLGVPQMNWMLFSNFSNKPFEGLVSEWHCKPFDQHDGDTITNTVPDLGPSGIDLTLIEGSPSVIEGITFEV